MQAHPNGAITNDNHIPAVQAGLDAVRLMHADEADLRQEIRELRDLVKRLRMVNADAIALAKQPCAVCQAGEQ